MKAEGVALLGLAALTLLGIVATGGDLAAAAAPCLGAAVLYLFWRAPLASCALALFFLALIADAPQDNPMDGMWRSPLYLIGQVLCSNWSASFNVPFAPFSGMDLCTLLLLARCFHERPGGAAASASVLRLALLAFLATVVALSLAGFLRGGAMGSAYWQVRQLVFIPIFAFLLAEARVPFAALGRAVPLAALIKAAAGLWFFFAIARPRGLHPPFITSHSDTLLFCLALTLLLLRWLLQPDPASLRRALWVAPVVLTAVWLNNRRMAWVGLGAVLFMVWRMTPWTRAKRALSRAGLVLAPLFAAYAVAGWSSTSAVFKPVASIRTIVATKEDKAADSSTRSREIENFNLAQTLRRHPLGTGLGHGYEEVVKGPDISKDFALYRFIPHNSVLWLLTAGGPAGFFLLWSLFLVGIFLAARSHRLAQTPRQRMAALGALAAQTLFLVQAWGDMGTQNWSTTWLLAAALAVSGRLAVETSAWPSASQEPAWTPQG